MHPVLNRNLFFVKEHLGFFKAANNYDIYDPETNEQILQCREDSLGLFTKMLRFTDYKRFTPSGEPIVHVRRGVTFLISEVDVLDRDDSGPRIGGFKQKLFSIGGAFQVLDSNNQPLFYLKGKWTGWDFRFIAADHELARVTKKW